MLPLDRRSRLTLAAAAFACGGAALASTPQSARGSVEPPPSAVAAAAASADPLPTRPAPVLPRRDPFAGHDETISAAASPAPAFTPFAASRTMTPAVRGSDGGDAVPDLGGAPAPSARTATTLHAIALGAHPVALIGNGTGDRLAAIGDDVDGRRIARITLDGVTLDDGAVLRLVATSAPRASAAPAETPAAAPTAPPASIPVYVVTPAVRATGTPEPAREPAR